MQSKITLRTKNQENVTHFKEKRPLRDASLETTHMLELSYKYFKVVIFNCVQ